VAYWLATQPAAWRDQVRYVAIDMCTVFVSAVRRLPASPFPRKVGLVGG